MNATEQQHATELLQHLLRVTAVIVPEDGHYIVQARERDYCAQGRARDMAIRAFRTGFVADALLHVPANVAQAAPCPDHVWIELTAREGAEISFFGFDIR